jgi:diguanylate cyclase (GGDEF)-like protein
MVEKLDIERFKYINDIFGFEEGDLVLKDLAKSIEFVINKNKDSFARIGSDEFIILKSYKSLEQIEKTRILYENQFFEIHGKNNMPLIRFRIGRYLLEPGEFSFTKIFEKVNHAHTLAKQQKGQMIYCYDESTKNSTMHFREIESKMENALKEHEFLVYLQPKYFLSDNSIIGAEALVRWEYNNNEALVYPSSFISLFEKNRFIMKLDFYMVERVCEIIHLWITEGIEPVTVSINFSRLHLLNHISFLRELCKIVNKYSIPRRYIEIEFTESVVFDNEEIFTDILIRLNNEGFSISMDDFGTGNYSLNALKNMPVDVIRITDSFFANSNDPQKSEIVTSYVMQMAKNLDISTVAERVETEEQIDMLKKVGCDIAQGYYYSKPMSVEDFTQQLRACKNKH